MEVHVRSLAKRIEIAVTRRTEIVSGKKSRRTFVFYRRENSNNKTHIHTETHLLSVQQVVLVNAFVLLTIPKKVVV